MRQLGHNGIADRTQKALSQTLTFTAFAITVSLLFFLCLLFHFCDFKYRQLMMHVYTPA